MCIVAYAYDADIHCTECSCEHFHVLDIDKTVYDKEGNNPTPCYDHDNDQFDHGAYCSDCGSEIYQPFCNGCEYCEVKLDSFIY
jgi:hypothetical protein